MNPIYKVWTPEEDALLRQLYSVERLTSIKCAEMLGRTVDSVRWRTAALGINDRNPRWTEDEIAYLRAAYRKTMARDIAKALGRPIRSVRRKAWELGLTESPRTNKKCRKVLTIEQKALLRREFPHVATAILATMLGLSPRTVIRHAREMGLEKTEQFMKESQQHCADKAKESHLKNGTYPPKGVVNANIAKGEAYRFKPGQCGRFINKQKPKTT